MKAIQVTNSNYDIVIKRLYLYYDKKSVKFDINYERNLFVQLPVFIPTYIQK